MKMATSNQDPEFYKDYTFAEIKKFESILRLIHTPQPNVELAKKMVSDFSDNKELERFKGFKTEFEAAIENSARNIQKHTKEQDRLKKRESEIGKEKKVLIHNEVHKAGNEFGKRSVPDSTQEGTTNKKRKK
jgi:hypothetical protein